MFHRPVSSTAVYCTIALVLIAAFTAHGADTLLPNGDFEAPGDRPEWPAQWPKPEGASWESEDGNHFLRLTPAKADQMLTVYRVVAVKPEHKAYAFSFRVRYTDLKRGKANWHDGRIILDFKDADGDKLRSGAKHPSFNGSSKGWVERTQEFAVPDGAATLDIMPALFQVASGTLDLDDLKLTPIDDPEKIAALRKAAEPPGPWPTPAAVATVAAPPADKLPPALRVVGNQLQTDDGKAVWLQGVAIPSMEWSAKGENILKSVNAAIDDWNANVIRLPVAEHFWFGYGPYQGAKDKGATYRNLVADVVNTAAARGAYVVIDLHRYRAPTDVHAGFWQDFAGHYKDHPAVIFELLNEPHDISWEVWQNGGIVPKEKKAGVVEENASTKGGFQSIGMQRLLDVIRETGAKNVVIAGGLDWGYDLSGILKGHALKDPAGRGIVYSSHVYPWKSDWQGKFLAIAEKHPVFIGECGAEPERMPFIPPERHEDPHTWSPDMLAAIQKHKLHWTAWCFHPKSTPRVLMDWNYTPTEFWGAYVKRALKGEQFEGKRVR